MTEDLDPTTTDAPSPPPVDEGTTPPETAPAPEDADTGERPEKRRRPTTLVELYTLPKAGAHELLATLVKDDAWNTSREDEDAALELLGERDRDLSKTRTLAQHVATSHDGRFAASLEHFLVSAVSPALDGTPSWPPGSETDGPRAFAGMLAHHAEALREKEPPRKLFNALMIAQSILMARYRLDVESAVPALSRTLGPPAALRGDRRNPRLTRLRALGDARLTVDALRTWLDVLSPWIERAVAAEKRADQAEADVRRHKAIEKDLDRQATELRAELTDAREEVARLRQDLQDKSDRERGVSLARQHEGSQLRGSMAGFLEDDVLSLLAAVREGLDLDPPRVPYSLERLEDAEHEIQSKVKWLRSSG